MLFALNMLYFKSIIKQDNKKSLKSVSNKDIALQIKQPERNILERQLYSI